MEVDLKIIEKVKSINKLFFLIRPKIDEDVESGMLKKTDHFNEEDLLLDIRDYVVKTIDFFRLVEAILKMTPTPEIRE